MGRRGRRRASAAAAASGPYIESLPLLGTTWYERGRAYWWRRVRAALGMFAILAIDLLFVGLLLKGIREESRTGFNIIIVVFGVLSIVTGVLSWRQIGRTDKPNRVSASDARWAGRAGAILGTTARAGSVLSAAVLFIGSLLLVGPLVVWFLRGLGRELPVERQAKKDLKWWYDNDRQAPGKTDRPASA